MSRELRICPGVGGRKCGAFLSSLDRDPHPTCARCRGKICTRDMTCDFCVGWSPAQWELFAKKCTYKEHKRSCHSGSVPPVTGASPRGGTSSEVPQPGTSSSSSRPSGGQDKRGGGGLGVHLVLRPVRLPLLPLDLGPATGVEVSLDVRLLRTSAPLSLQLLRELQRWRLLCRSGLPLPAPLPRLLLPHSSQHAPQRDELREASVDHSCSRSSRVSRSSDRGTRKDRGARSRSDSSRDRGRRSHSRSAYRSRSRASEAVVFSVAVLLRTVAA